MNSGDTQTVRVLDLSGPVLRASLESLVDAAALAGGIEALIEALRVKVRLFGELLENGHAASLDEVQFLGLCNFMPTVRRRIGAWLEVHGFALLRERLITLLDQSSPIERRLMSFQNNFPLDRGHRWVRELAAEVIHFTATEQIPLMTRWIWDAGTGTGVLREIWYTMDDAPEIPNLPDDPLTFFALREELNGFLRDHGMFRDLSLIQDLLCAHIYAGYINDRGGTYLKADFARGEDPLAHTRRMLGLDAINSEGLRPRVKLPPSLRRSGQAPHLSS